MATTEEVKIRVQTDTTAAVAALKRLSDGTVVNAKEMDRLKAAMTAVEKELDKAAKTAGQQLAEQALKKLKSGAELTRSEIDKLKSTISSASSQFQDAAKPMQRFTDGLGKAIVVANQGLELLNKGLRGIEKIARFAREGGELLQQETAFAKLGVEVTRFEEAVDGSLSKQQIWTSANKAMRGEIALTAKEFETSLRAADNFGDTVGGSTKENVDKIVHALQTGSFKALREFGIAIDTSKSKVDQFADAMEALEKVAAEASPENATNKAWERFDANMANLANTMKARTAPALAEVSQYLSDIVTLSERFDKWMGSPQARAMQALSGGRDAARIRGAAILDDSGGGGLYRVASTLGIQNAAGPTDKAIEQIGTLAGASRIDPQEYARTVMGFEFIDAFTQSVEEVKNAAHKAVRDKALARMGGVGDSRYFIPGEDVGERTLEGPSPFNLNFFERAALQVQRQAFGGSLILGAREGGLASVQALAPATRASALGGSGGIGIGAAEGAIASQLKAVEDFKTKLNDVSTVAGSTFQSVNAGLLAGFDALVSGSGNFAKAFQKAIAGQMKASGLQNAARAIEFTAMAIAGFPNAGAAAAKFAIAAAANFAGAALLGALGGGGGGGGGGTGGGGFGGGSGFARPPSQAPEQKTIIVQITGGSDSRKELAEEISRAVVAGEKSGRSRSTSVIKFG